MTGRLAHKIAIVVGGGQSPGAALGNGRATALRFAQEGACVAVLDRSLESAMETVSMIDGDAFALAVDVCDERSLAAAVAQTVERWGRLDILHNNVGVSITAGDAPLADITEDAFDRIMAINLRGTVMACKHAMPIMRGQKSGCIINISSTAAKSKNPFVGYKTSKAAILAFTQQLANVGAPDGIRANAILPGLMDTPMSVDSRVAETGRSREDIVAERDKRVPLRGKQGDAWDVANAALFLASDEAGHITGAMLPVDGGILAAVGP